MQEQGGPACRIEEGRHERKSRGTGRRKEGRRTHAICKLAFLLFPMVGRRSIRKEEKAHEEGGGGWRGMEGGVMRGGRDRGIE